MDAVYDSNAENAACVVRLFRQRDALKPSAKGYAASGDA